MSEVDAHDSEALFDLVYEGATDDSARTLQRIKGVFVADLNLPIPEIQRILEHAPSTISSAESAKELEDAKRKLSAAGARVLIIRRGGPDAAPYGDPLIEQILSEAEAAVDAQEEQESEPPPPETDEGLSFEFEFGQIESKPAEPKAAKVYTLDLDENQNVDEIVGSIADSGEESESAIERDPPTLDLSALPSATPSGAISILSEEETNAFHLSRGAALEAPAPAVLGEPEELSPLVDPSVPLDVAPADPLPELSATDEQAKVAREVSLVLEGLSTEEPVSSGVAAAATIPQAPSKDTPKKPGVLSAPAASEIDLSFDEPAQEPEVTPAPKASPPSATRPAAAEAKPAFDVDEPQPSAAAKPTPSRAPTNGPEVSEKNLAPDIEVIAEHETGDLSSLEEANSPRPMARPKRKTKGVPYAELAIPIVLGTVVLGVGNWLYFSEAPPPPKKLTVAAVEGAAVAAEVPKATAVALKIWEPSLKDSTRSVNVRIEQGGSVVLLDSFKLETPLPRERTNEEIVKGIPLPPWVRRIEAGPLEFKVEGAALRATGGAVGYLVYNGAPVRVPLELSATLIEPTASSGYRLEFRVGNGAEAVTDPSVVFASRKDDGSYAVASEGVLEFGRPKSEG